MAHRICTLDSEEEGKECLQLTRLDHLTRVLAQDRCSPGRRERNPAPSRSVSHLEMPTGGLR